MKLKLIRKTVHLVVEIPGDVLGRLQDVGHNTL